MATPHNTLGGAELHRSRILTFTGPAANVTPAEAGILYMSTDTNLVYRSTGSAAGNLQRVGNMTGAELVAALEALAVGSRLSYNFLDDLPTIPTGVGIKTPGEFILYAGTLDSNNPRFTASAFSGRLITLDGQLYVTDGSSIGSASSAAQVADARMQNLFRAMWGNGGVTISGGIGASSLADWNANKSLTLPLYASRALVATGTGSGLLTWTLGQFRGEENHVQTLEEMVTHNHGLATQSNTQTGGAAIRATGPGSDTNTGVRGSGVGFNVVQPSVGAGRALFAVGVAA